MQNFAFSFSVLCAVLLLAIVGNYSVLGSSYASTSSLDEIQTSVNSNQSNNSAVEKLALALQQDKDDGDENGGENWDSAIESLSAEMGIPVDDDIEDALMEITETHLDNISNNWDS